jgi:integrase/recombinase XerC/integrase/recombinase XerD
LAPQQKLSLVDALDLFLLDCEARQFTAHTLRFYRGRLGLFVAWCVEHDAPALGDVGAPTIRRFIVDLARRKLSSAYVHGFARAIRAFLNYCVRDELLDISPFARVQMPRLEKKILPALTATELQRVLAACTSARDRAIVLTLLDSGLRASELCALDLADVDRATGAVMVRRGKGQKDRVSYIGPYTRKQVAKYLHLERQSDDPALFVSQTDGERLTYYGLAQALQRLRRIAQTPTLTAHALRRTFALNSLRGGMNIFVLAKLMGHADLTVLRQYLQLVEDDLQDAHRRVAVVETMLKGGKRSRGPPG